MQYSFEIRFTKNGQPRLLQVQVEQPTEDFMPRYVERMHADVLEANLRMIGTEEGTQLDQVRILAPEQKDITEWAQENWGPDHPVVF
jgi:hypothetical protein